MCLESLSNYLDFESKQNGILEAFKNPAVVVDQNCSKCTTKKKEDLKTDLKDCITLEKKSKQANWTFNTWILRE